MFEILNIPIGMFRILNVPWANWNSYLEGGGLQDEEIVKSTLFCKVHYVLNSDINFLKVSCKNPEKMIQKIFVQRRQFLHMNRQVDCLPLPEVEITAKLGSLQALNV